MAPRQLALPFAFNPEFGFEQFQPGANAEAVRHLRAAAEATGEPLIFLWGESGSGRSHLLNACCRQAAQCGRTLAYLPLAEIGPHGPAALDGLDGHDLVCLDDLDRVAGDEDWEAELFHLFNRLRDGGRTLIVCANLPPGQLPIRLPDLKTRLGWGLTLRLQGLNDADKLAVLERYAKTRGLILPPAVGKFLLVHYRRDLPSLRQLLTDLDRATIAARRPLTVPFVKSYLEENP